MLNSNLVKIGSGCYLDRHLLQKHENGTPDTSPLTLQDFSKIKIKLGKITESDDLQQDEKTDNYLDQVDQRDEEMVGLALINKKSKKYIKGQLNRSRIRNILESQIEPELIWQKLDPYVQAKLVQSGLFGAELQLLKEQGITDTNSIVDSLRNFYYL